MATYSNAGWSMCTTNAESARQIGMGMAYNEAYGKAQKGIPLNGETAVGIENTQNTFDVKA